MDHRLYQTYFDFLGKLGGIFEQLTAIARKKTMAVRRDDLMTVNECIREEQALSLALRSMDRKREKLLADLGLQNIPLSGLTKSCPAQLRPQARAVSERLSTQYALYRSAAEAARTTLECNLHQIEKIIADRAESPAGEKKGSFADIRA